MDANKGLATVAICALAGLLFWQDHEIMAFIVFFFGLDYTWSKE